MFSGARTFKTLAGSENALARKNPAEFVLAWEVSRGETADTWTVTV